MSEHVRTARVGRRPAGSLRDGLANYAAQLCARLFLTVPVNSEKRGCLCLHRIDLVG